MNKKVIWLIIGLMSVALIGVAGMQLKWVLDTLKANEAQFDSHVFDALNTVVEKLEYQESLEAMRQIDSGWARDFYEQDLKKRIESGELQVSLKVSDEHVDHPGHVHLTKQQLLEYTISANSCNCSKCTKEKADRLSQYVSYTAGLDMTPITERVDLKKLDGYLRQQFQDLGIKTPFRYGVFDNNKNSFVIADGKYVVEDKLSQTTLTGYKNLYNSDFRVNMFHGDTKSPGMLMVYFPLKNSFIWQTVIKTLVGSIFFMSIILFCFAYTISVIFRQKKLSEMKNDFINNMTHEFKTPIATISLASDSIASPRVINSPEKIKRFTNIIRQENKRMNNQVEKVLQMARIDSQDFTMNMGEVNLHDIISKAVGYISLQVEKKDGTVTADLKATQPVIKGDMTHIANVINNLLDNANKYSPDKPEISIATRNVNGGVEVIVSDKGIGMSKEARKHIFEKFYRVHTGNLHDVKGFGLGLSYVKVIMDAHKGKVDVKSELGKGSSFVLFFPANGVS
ncbi:MAG TPA: HAMP domain-containing histidine kinase [Bacteroidetes bacterium]|nr:HAMP domain-containing histidine kinase [Bacteroidota bacterium]